MEVYCTTLHGLDWLIASECLSTLASISAAFVSCICRGKTYSYSGTAGLIPATPLDIVETTGELRRRQKRRNITRRSVILFGESMSVLCAIILFLMQVPDTSEVDIISSSLYSMMARVC
jgi:hypothetical protein